MTLRGPEKLPGTRPAGALDERDASARVRKMFTRIAPRYDFLNHLLSFSLDRLWRRRTSRHFREVLSRPDARILDICCGTGDLAFALDRARARSLPRAAVGSRLPIFASDFVEPMLLQAREKSKRGGISAIFIAADALSLPFPSDSFDLVTSAFGFRNLSNYEHGLLEFARVLRRGGALGILEFTEPEHGPMAALFRFYFQHILPRLGRAISGDSDAYSYLPASVSKFPSPPALAALIARCGFSQVQFASWNFGSVILHSATRD
ncbi:MAG: ubiquinone/menaquinone biosynthesis methyltransferase [Candidatus Acidiferrales bacterium]